MRVVPTSGPKDQAFKWLLLILNIKETTINFRKFTSRREATIEIAKIEKFKQEDIDAVLVWVKSISELRAAYPNYYADTREFIEALDSALRRLK